MDILIPKSNLQPSSHMFIALLIKNVMMIKNKETSVRFKESAFFSGYRTNLKGMYSVWICYGRKMSEVESYTNAHV